MPKRRTAVEREQSETSTVRVEAAFKQAWADAWPGVPLVDYKWGRDRKHLKMLVESLGEEAVVALIGEFFEAVRNDPVVSRCNNPNVPAFAYHAQYLLLRKSRRRPHQRTAENLAEAKKAMGK